MQEQGTGWGRARVGVTQPEGPEGRAWELEGAWRAPGAEGRRGSLLITAQAPVKWVFWEQKRGRKRSTLTLHIPRINVLGGRNKALEAAWVKHRDVLSRSPGGWEPGIHVSTATVACAGCGKAVFQAARLALEMAFFSLCLFALFSPSVCLSVQMSPFHKDTSHSGSGVHPTPYDSS